MSVHWKIKLRSSKWGQSNGLLGHLPTVVIQMTMALNEDQMKQVLARGVQAMVSEAKTQQEVAHGALVN